MATPTQQDNNLPVKKQFEVKYQVGDIPVVLTPEIVKNYLVRGKKELATVQELVFFMGLCRARGMNPFAGDCYPLKYTQDDPMAMIVAIDFKRARAIEQANCQGWQKGVIVQKKDGELRYSNGIVLEGEKLIGGWFRAQPEGWAVPFELEVNLAGYIKKTNTGNVTKFWKEENQATMIAKVAESQGLSAVWSRHLGKMYTPEEMGEEEPRPVTMDMGPGGEVLGSVELFMDLAKEKTKGDSKLQASLFRYVVACADHYKTDQDQIKRDASLQFDQFWQNFERWLKQAGQGKPQGQAKAPEPETGNGKGQADPPSEGQPGGQEGIMVTCPKNGGDKMKREWCENSCADNFECEAWRK